MQTIHQQAQMTQLNLAMAFGAIVISTFWALNDAEPLHSRPIQTIRYLPKKVALLIVKRIIWIS